MHSKIFQISQKPIEDRISEDRYYYGFVGKVADDVSELDMNGQLGAINWLAETPRNSGKKHQRCYGYNYDH